MTNPYLELTARFNEGRLRALISSGQAVVVHRLAAKPWAALWPEVAREVAGLPLQEAHRVVTSRAEGILPFEPPGEAS